MEEAQEDWNTERNFLLEIQKESASPRNLEIENVAVPLPVATLGQTKVENCRLVLLGELSRIANLSDKSISPCPKNFR